MRLKIRRTARR